LSGAGVKVSMDGRGRWLEPVEVSRVLIERLWRSLKNQCVYLDAFDPGTDAGAGIGKWLTYYNAEHPHSALGGRTPEEA
jgi:putative transposase